METKPNFFYTIEPAKLPYGLTVRCVSRWSKRLQVKTGKNVFYRVSVHKVEIWHDGIGTASHNKAVKSLTKIIDKVIGYEA